MGMNYKCYNGYLVKREGMKNLNDIAALRCVLQEAVRFVDSRGLDIVIVPLSVMKRAH
jgi:hypothetical protein